MVSRWRATPPGRPCDPRGQEAGYERHRSPVLRPAQTLAARSRGSVQLAPDEPADGFLFLAPSLSG
jgi:hypothetical protein